MAYRFFLLVIVGVVSTTSCGDVCPKESCSEYTSEEAAQHDLDAFPEACADLDQNGDKVACNEPGNGITVCPSTAACGCSNLRKAECNTLCCAWTVGEGCDCR